jgi:hypothetical protein
VCPFRNTSAVDGIVLEDSTVKYIVAPLGRELDAKKTPVSGCTPGDLCSNSR